MSGWRGPPPPFFPHAEHTAADRDVLSEIIPKKLFLTKLPVLRQLCDSLYRVFAKYRLKVTGRCLDEACELRKSASSQEAA